MIPEEISEFIFPQPADNTPDAVVLKHACGIDFQFAYMETDVITNVQLKKWRTKIDKLASIAGENCFSYNTLKSTENGVYHDTDGNSFALLLSPASFLEHNEVEGQAILLIIDKKSCILTGSDSTAGRKLMDKFASKSMAKNIVGIDRKWTQWQTI